MTQQHGDGQWHARRHVNLSKLDAGRHVYTRYFGFQTGHGVTVQVDNDEELQVLTVDDDNKCTIKNLSKWCQAVGNGTVYEVGYGVSSWTETLSFRNVCTVLASASKEVMMRRCEMVTESEKQSFNESSSLAFALTCGGPRDPNRNVIYFERGVLGILLVDDFPTVLWTNKTNSEIVRMPLHHWLHKKCGGNFGGCRMYSRAELRKADQDIYDACARSLQLSTQPQECSGTHFTPEPTAHTSEAVEEPAAHSVPAPLTGQELIEDSQNLKLLLKEGDHLTVRMRWGAFHHGIVSDVSAHEGTMVAHVIKKKGKVQRTTLASFLKSGVGALKIFDSSTPKNSQWREDLEAAYNKPWGYEELRNNCEHFVNSIRSGEHRCIQCVVVRCALTAFMEVGAVSAQVGTRVVRVVARLGTHAILGLVAVGISIGLDLAIIIANLVSSRRVDWATVACAGGRLLLSVGGLCCLVIPGINLLVPLILSVVQLLPLNAQLFVAES